MFGGIIKKLSLIFVMLFLSAFKQNVKCSEPEVVKGISVTIICPPRTKKSVLPVIADTLVPRNASTGTDSTSSKKTGDINAPDKKKSRDE